MFMNARNIKKLTSKLDELLDQRPPSGLSRSVSNAVKMQSVNKTSETTAVGLRWISSLDDSANEPLVQSSVLNGTNEIVSEIQSSDRNEMCENSTLQPDQSNSIPRESSYETQPSSANRAHDHDMEMQPYSVNKMVRNATVQLVPGEETNMFNHPSSEAEPSSVNRLDDNGKKIKFSGTDKMVEKSTVPDGKTTMLSDSSKEADLDPSDVNRLDDNSNVIQFSNADKVTENTTVPGEVICKPKDSSNETQPPSLNKGDNSVETESSNVNKTVENASVLGGTVIPNNFSNETKPSIDQNSVDHNGTELQSFGVNKVTENATSQCKRTSAQKNSFNYFQATDVNGVGVIGTELPSSVNKVAENATIHCERTSGQENSLSQFQASDVNRVGDIGTKLQSSIVNTVAENASASDLRFLHPETSSNETQSFGLNRVENNGSEMQCHNLDLETEDVSTLGEVAITNSDLINQTQSCSVNKTSENTSLVEYLINESHNNFDDPENEPGTNTSLLDKDFSTQEMYPSVESHNNTEDKQTRHSGLTDPEEKTDLFVTTDKRMLEKTGGSLKRISNIPITDCDKPSVSRETVDCSTVDRASSTATDVMPLPDGTEPSVSSVTLGEIESTLKCISDAPGAGHKDLETILCDMIVETACSYVAMEHSNESLRAIDASVNVISESMMSQKSQGRVQDLCLTEDPNQPTRKKIKLSKSVSIPLKDLLGGVHTRLCESNCTSKHNPFVLAVGVPNDCKLRSSLENHLKLSLKNGWKSSIGIKDPCSQLRQLVFLMAVLFGKLELLEFMLKVQLTYSQFFAHSTKGLPILLLFKNMHRFMPSSYFDEKIAVFKQVLMLLAKYDSDVLLMQDELNDDTVLHVCAKQIRKLTTEIKSKESVSPDSPELQQLLNQRELCDRFCEELIHMLQKLAVEGPLHQSQVLEFFDVRNKAGETIFEILQDEKLKRSGSNDGNTDHVMEQGPEGQEHSAGETAAGKNTAAQTLPALQAGDLQCDLPTVQNVSMSVSVACPSGTTASSTNCSSFQNFTGCKDESMPSVVSVSLQNVSLSVDFAHSSGTTALSMNCSSAENSTGCKDESKPSAVSILVSSLQSATVQQVSTDRTALQTSTATTSTGSETDSADEGQSQSQEEGELHIHIPKSPGKYHTFLCPPKCDVQHHELIQLLCATPDHNSLIIPAVENESCSNFRTYLKGTAWDLHAVVPDHLPKLCYSIIHLACLLGKYKALEVLSEFGIHPLIHTAITEETPLHMTVHLLQLQPLGSLFLCNAVVSIVKTLNRHSHAISLFSAKDYRGNTVLHSLAKMISPTKSYSETTATVYLFRVFVHLLLRGQTSSPTVTQQILSSSLKDCNKAGESVEVLLQNTVVGEKLLKYLIGLMGGGEATGSASVQCDISNDDSSQPVPVDDEPESLIDFVISQGGDEDKYIENKERAVGYHKEYQRKLRFLQGKVLRLRKELKAAKKEESKINHLQKNEPIIKSSIDWNKARIQSVIEERNRQREELSLNNHRLELLGKLKHDIEQWELLQ